MSVTVTCIVPSPMDSSKVGEVVLSTAITWQVDSDNVLTVFTGTTQDTMIAAFQPNAWFNIRMDPAPAKES